MCQREVCVKTPHCVFNVIDWHEISILHIRLLHYFGSLKAGMSFHQFSFRKGGWCVCGISAISFISMDLVLCYIVLKTMDCFISLLWQDHHTLL